MAERIQLSRKRGWRLPECAVSVARPTRWGNPYQLGIQLRRDNPLRLYLDWAVMEVTGVDATRPLGAYEVITPGTAAVAVAAYRFWLWGRPDLIREAQEELVGVDLACWCPLPADGEPDVCHAAELLRVASYPAG